MGLGLEVGHYAALLRNDPEGTAEFEAQLSNLNRALAAAGLPPHSEPAALPETAEESFDMWGYAGLHRLRRVAASEALGEGLPAPLLEADDEEDPRVGRYYEAALGSPNLLARLFGRAKPRLRRFQHLMLHSDAEGFYVPQDFVDVLFPAQRLAIRGGMIGSSARLAAECRELAALLGIPPGLARDSEAVAAAIEARAADAREPWQRYPVETFCCLQLLGASEHSMKTGALLVFT
jgi:hypothetical protein